MTGDRGQHRRLSGEEGDAIGGSHGQPGLHRLAPELTGVGEAGLHGSDERLVPADRPGHLGRTDLTGDRVQPLEAAGGPGRVGQLNGDGVGRRVHGELQVRVTGGRRGRDRPGGHVGTQPRRRLVGAPQGVQHRGADPGQQRLVLADVGQRDGLAGQLDAPGRGRVADEILGQQGQQPGARARSASATSRAVSTIATCAGAAGPSRRNPRSVASAARATIALAPQPRASAAACVNVAWAAGSSASCCA